jgi:hypothetical protein
MMKKNKPAESRIGSVSVAEHWYEVGYRDAQADAKAKRKKQYEESDEKKGKGSSK